MSAKSKQAVDSTEPPWADRIDSLPPTVLILGGFLTAPPMYGRMAERLVARGAAGVVVADVWPQDWIIAMVRGCAAIAARSGRALLAAGLLSANVSDGAPVLVVGHSAGGLIARLLTAPEPFPGRRPGAAARIGAIVTLGTPHVLSGGEGIGRRLNDMVSAAADDCVPGSFHAPGIGYVSVASRSFRGDPAGTGRERISYLLYRSVMGRRAAPGLEGDGMVPVPATRLEGARQLVLDGSIHGPGAGGPWYGTDDALNAWWPVALEAWRAALTYRAGRISAVDPSPPCLPGIARV